MGSWKGRGNRYTQFVRVLYCKLSTNCKQLPAFPLEAMQGTKPRHQRWEARVLPLCHCGPFIYFKHHFQHCIGDITMVNFMGRGNEYIQLLKVMYCKLPTIDKGLKTFISGLYFRSILQTGDQMWETSLLLLHHHHSKHSHVQCSTHVGIYFPFGVAFL